MPNPIIGALMSAALMHGARSIVPTMIKHAVVVNFVLPAFGVPLKMRELMLNKSSVSWITAAATAKKMRNKP